MALAHKGIEADRVPWRFIDKPRSPFPDSPLCRYSFTAMRASAIRGVSRCIWKSASGEAVTVWRDWCDPRNSVCE